MYNVQYLFYAYFSSRYVFLVTPVLFSVLNLSVWLNDESNTTDTWKCESKLLHSVSQRLHLLPLITFASYLDISTVPRSFYSMVVLQAQLSLYVDNETPAT